MSEKILKTRIQLKYDTVENWQSTGASLVLKKGEVAICAVPSGTTIVNGDPARPQVLFKVGDGTSTFAQLKWASAMAADVHTWAKKSESEFTTWVKSLISVEDVDLSNYYTKREVDTKVSTNTTAITAIKDGTTINSFKKVEDALTKKADIVALSAEIERAKVAEKKNADAIELLTNGSSPEEVDSVKDLIQYVTDHGTEVVGMKKDISGNTAAITAEKRRAEGAETTLRGEVDVLKGTAHSHANKAVLDGITSGKVSAWDAAEKNAKTYADGLSKNYATASQGTKADSALQSITTTINGGLKVTNKNQIDFDTNITFVLDCGSASV